MALILIFLYLGVADIVHLLGQILTVAAIMWVRIMRLHSRSAGKSVVID